VISVRPVDNPSSTCVLTCESPKGPADLTQFGIVLTDEYEAGQKAEAVVFPRPLGLLLPGPSRHELRRGAVHVYPAKQLAQPSRSIRMHIHGTLSDLGASHRAPVRESLEVEMFD
jgi:hypothetical protein